MTTFSRSYPSNGALTEAAESWAEDLIEVEPDQLAQCFADAQDLHLQLQPENRRFPLTSTEVKFSWRRIVARQMLNDMLTDSANCKTCNNTMKVTIYDHELQQDVEVPCPYHVS